MILWREVEVGTIVVHEGQEMEVRVIKPGARSMRVVLANTGDGVSAKVATKVKPTEQVELPEGAEAPDKAGRVVESVLGAREIAEVTEEGIVCPPMNVTLIASHLRIMHGIELEGLPVSDEVEYLKIHTELHEAPFHEPAHPHTHEERAS